MDFFARQERARRNTRLALVLFAAAVVAIVLAVDLAAALAILWLERSMQVGARVDAVWLLDHWRVLAWVSVCTLVVIALGALVETAHLRKGGSVVAERLGGRRIDVDSDDLRERRLINVVHEMALASGLPVPEVYLLDREPAINAFAAGLSPEDAAIGVTRGALERLTRSELQGVVAHEFSHILHGDMRLNMRLLGVLHGILLIAIVGKRLLLGFRRGGRFPVLVPSRRSRRGSSGAEGSIALVGLVLIVIGYVGLFFARLIQALVSRQRELLADAAAVQFTRYPQGLAGALKRIAGLDVGSALQSADAETVSHLLFSSQRKPWTQWMATHPPLVERIRALDPQFDPALLSTLAAVPPPEPSDLDSVAALAPAGDVTLDPQAVVERVGQPDSRHLVYAARLLHSLPQNLRAQLADPVGAERVVLAAALGDERTNRAAQVALLQSDGRNEQDLAALAACWRTVRDLGPAARLPLIDLACVTLKRRPATEIRRLVADVERLIHADAQIDLSELALLAVLRAHLRDALPQRHHARRLSLHDAREDVRLLLAALARAGNSEPQDAELAFEVGATDLYGSQSLAWPAQPPRGEEVLKALDRLEGLSQVHKRALVAALVATASHDGTVSMVEAEMLRALCAAMHIPVPPLAA